jgi:hypothetical protein
VTRPLHRRPVVRGVLGLFVGLGGGLVTITAVDRLSNETERESTELGRLDVEGYCAREPGMRALHLTRDAHGWRCAAVMDRVRDVREVDTHAACRWQFGPAAYAVLVDAADPDGWWCVRDS